jgi:hypothetical protein
MKDLDQKSAHQFRFSEIILSKSVRPAELSSADAAARRSSSRLKLAALEISTVNAPRPGRTTRRHSLSLDFRNSTARPATAIPTAEPQ